MSTAEPPSAIPDDAPFVQGPRANSPVRAGAFGVFKRPAAPSQGGAAYGAAPGAQPRATSPFRTMAEHERAEARTDEERRPFAARKVRTVAPAVTSAGPNAVIDQQLAAGALTAKRISEGTFGRSARAAGLGDVTSDMTSEILHFMADPVIRVPFKTAPGALPRSIALERKRRELAGVNAVELFSEIPEIAQQAAPAAEGEGAEQQTHLPIEMFDDSEFDTRTMEAWWEVARPYDVRNPTTGRVRSLRGLYGQALLGGQWARVVVIGQRRQEGAAGAPYDDRLLCVLRENPSKKFWVPRLFVYIWGEDPRIYAQRLRQAVFLRAQAESIMRYELFIQSMPTSGLFPFSAGLRDAILARSRPAFNQREVLGLDPQRLDSLKAEVVQAQAAPLLREAEDNYYAGQNKVLFDASLQRQPSLISELDLEPAADYIAEARYAQYHDTDRSLDVYRGLICTANYDSFADSLAEDNVSDATLCYSVGQYLSRRFQSSRSAIGFSSFLTSPEAVQALGVVSAEAEKILGLQPSPQELQRRSLQAHYADLQALPFDEVAPNLSLYAITPRTASPALPLTSKVLSLEDFKAAQLAHSRRTRQYLEETWVTNLKFGILDALGRCGKGWFDVETSSKEIYNASKLRRLLHRVTLSMADTLRFLVEASCRAYVDMFRQGSLWSVRCRSTCDVVSSHADNALREGGGEGGQEGEAGAGKGSAPGAPVVPPLALGGPSAGSADAASAVGVADSPAAASAATDAPQDRPLCGYRQPLFSIALSVLDLPTSSRDRQIISKLDGSYIYGVEALNEEDMEPDDEEEAAPDAEADEDSDAEAEEDPLAPPEAQKAPVPSLDLRAAKPGSAGASGAAGRGGASARADPRSSARGSARREEPAAAPAAPIPESVHAIGYATSPADYVAAVLQVFDSGMAASASVPEIEPLILQNIVWADRTHIATPSLQEEQFVAYRSRLVDYMEEAVRPLDAYLECFEPYRELILLDEEKWVSTVRFRAELYLRQTQADSKKGEEPPPAVPEDVLRTLPLAMQAAVQNATPLSPDDLRALVHEQVRRQREVLLTVPESIQVGLFVVRNGSVRSYLSAKCARLAELTQEVVGEIAGKKAAMISQTYFTINRRVSRKNKSIEEVAQVEEYIKGKVDGLLAGMKRNIQIMQSYHNILDELFVSQSNQAIQLRYKTQSYPLEIKNLVKKTMELLALDREKFRDEQSQQQQSLDRTLEAATRQVTGFPLKYTSLAEYAAAAEEAEQLGRQLGRLHEKAKLYNRREALMDLPITDYSRLDQVIRDFEPQGLLWKTILSFNTAYKEAMDSDFRGVDASLIEKQVDACYRNISKAQRSLKEGQGNSRAIAEQIKRQIGEFKQYLPLLVAMRNPGFRKRHWIRLSKELDVDLRGLRYINGVEVRKKIRLQKEEPAKEEDEEDSQVDYTEMTDEQLREINERPIGFTFRQAVEVYRLNEPRNFAIIAKVSEIASKEFAIEQVLNNLEKDWAGIDFDLLEYANTNTYVLRSMDDIIQKLDDNITLVQTMIFSPFKKFFEDQIASWESRLSLVSEIIDVWLQVQQQWLYLEPVFSSPDISRQLPTESKNFRGVDSQWRKLMASTYKTPNVLDVCLNTDKLLQKLKECNKVLETVQKGLSDYLESKRQAFARFYFLSDGELLSILSQTRDPNSVQPFFRSCFENISRVKFAPEDQDYEMTGMWSHEGEWVQFSEPMFPKASVEVWMGHLERMMIRTVRQRVFESLLAYQKAVAERGVSGRSDWVCEHFAQGVLCTSQLYFARDVEEALESNALAQYLDRCRDQLNSLTALVRRGLSKLEAKTLSALLTLDVHNRDVVESLVAAKITRATDFEWMSQLRYYVNLTAEGQEEPLDIMVGRPDCQEYYAKTSPLLDVVVRQVQTVYPYGFEYLGNTSRLVITPLTDRIYMTLTGALAVNLGGAPAGPAGTGKTETTKDLAKALAQPIIVFNCSDGLDYKAMGKFFTGLAMAGAWACFDEFNRINLEVLSVIAQQILSIQLAIIRKAERFLFEGREISIKPTCAVFITMNPGYAGRTELPDNLKALFRGVSCMVPDYSLIAEIRLYSFGFTSAKNLARKTTASFKLSSEQLSTQSHYDFGMRALNTTIQAAGNMIAEYTVGGELQVTEEQILLRAVKEVNLPKFLSNDVILFNNIVQDMFPGVETPSVDYHLLVNMLSEVLRSNAMGYRAPEESFLKKIVEVYQTILLRHGLMLVGQASSGKTTALDALALALSRLNQDETQARLQQFQRLLKQDPDMPVREAEALIGEDYNYLKVHQSKLNPKSVTMGQLYGEYDLVSHEWSDGIIADLIRKAVAAYNSHTAQIEQTLVAVPQEEREAAEAAGGLQLRHVSGQALVQRLNHSRQWLVCDGPIDALWIESMNTVLDDNKKLCLTSGEIIALTNVISMIFEVEDLTEASPATVSRAGMIFFNGVDTVSIKSYIESWIDRLPDDLRLEDPAAAKAAEPPVSARGSGLRSKVGKTEKLSDIAVRFQELFQTFMVPTIEFVHRNCSELVRSLDQNLMTSTTRILDCFVREFKPNEFGVIEPFKIDLLARYLEPFFFFALVWGAGGSIATEECRLKFDRWLRAKIQDGGFLTDFPIPAEDSQGNPLSVFDFCFSYGDVTRRPEDIDAGNAGDAADAAPSLPVGWAPWQRTIPEFSIDALAGGKPIEYNDIFVPTTDTIRSTYLLRKLLTNGFPVLAVGKTGTSKTMVVKNYLLRGPEEDMAVNIPVFVNFSARTSANQTQDYIDSKMEKRRKGIYGPLVGKKLVIFVDDVNLPMKEQYGAIPAVELLRQMVDHGGWYDRAELSFRQIIDTSLVTAMGPPGGGRQAITNRLLRHLNFLCFPEMTSGGLAQIFGKIVDWWSARSFADEAMRQLARKLMGASSAVYSACREQLLPTPEKSHYTFNLRDLSKVFQGVLMVDAPSLTTVPLENGESRPATPEEFEQKLLRLWTHEILRVFSDRLVCEEDKALLNGILDSAMQKHFSRDLSQVLNGAHPDSLIYGDFMNLQQYPRPYREITDFGALGKVLSEALSDYNDQNAKAMNLVLFRMAVSHLSRIARIIKQPSGNCLLIGLGGSGRSSLARLAAFLADYDLATIELRKNYGLAEWRDDLKRILLTAGLENKQLVFLFSDSMIVNESMTEDINAILNTADIQNLYEPADLESIYTAMKSVVMEKGQQPTKLALFDAYLNRVRNNIHLVLTFSPSQALRTRLRNFPSLVNCCTLDWFTGWPDEALRDVGNYVYCFTPERARAVDSPQAEFLHRYLGELAGGDEAEKQRLQDSIIAICMKMHLSIERYSELYRREANRLNHVTPTLYLNLLSVFTKIIQEQYNKIVVVKTQLKTGLTKLQETSETVSKMQEELTALQPVLERTQREVEDMMVELERDKTSADKTRQTVASEKQIAAGKKDECEAIKNDAERDLAEAIPALEAALAALKSLKVADLGEVGHFLNPPVGVKLVMEAVCQFFEAKPNRIPDKDHPGQYIEDYWDTSKKLLSEPRSFMDRLLNYDRDSIKPEIIKRIQRYINDPAFQPKEVEKVSKAAVAMCSWAHAMNKYHFVAKAVEPKKQRLREAEADLAVVQKNLDELIAQLEEVEARIASLEEQFNAAVQKKEDLSQQVEETGKRLLRAEKLISGLGGERDRWTRELGENEARLKTILGDCLFSAGAITYLGAFTSEFRARIKAEWERYLDGLRLPRSAQLSTREILSDEVEIQNYIVNGLPTDGQSVENALLMYNSDKYPLLIDPQGQGQKFIRNMEKDNSLTVCKATDKDLLRNLENAIRFGKPMLIANVREEIDPALDTVLQRNVYKDGNGLVIKLNDQVIPFNTSFRLYLVTSLPNPRFSPEAAVKVLVLNFAINESGLEEQLLATVVNKERQDLEAMKSQLVVSNSRMRQELKSLEAKILKLLSESSGDILSDESLIEVLSQSQRTSQEIATKVAESESTEKEIDATRELYRPVARRASLLYFCCCDLSGIDSMYQYSLQWYVNLFVQAISDAEQSEDLAVRLRNLMDHFTHYLYTTICRSLFEAHKLLFALVVAIRIAYDARRLDLAELRYLLIGSSSSQAPRPNPCPQWLSDRSWITICDLEAVSPAFAGLADSFLDPAAADTWRQMFESGQPDTAPYPEPFQSRLTPFQRFLPLMCIRPDKIIAYARTYIGQELGPRFNDPQLFNLELSYKDSNNVTPLLFILSAGSDPMADLLRFAEDMRMTRKLQSISLGQGQGAIASQLISQGVERGLWVCLMNCHLAQSWMPDLEKTLEQLQQDSSNVHRDFRLWLTSMPTEAFPVSVLQNSVKMTNEAALGMKNNILRTYGSLTDKFLNESIASGDQRKVEVFKKLSYSMAVFHAVIQERRKFGPLGFNIAYDFTSGDLDMCFKQLGLFLDSYSYVPYNVLRFLFGKINYCGRVTDYNDESCVTTILEDYLTEAALHEGYDFSRSDDPEVRTIRQLGDGLNYKDYIDAIREQVPNDPRPEVFGLHVNAAITCDNQQVGGLLEGLIRMMPKDQQSAGAGAEAGAGTDSGAEAGAEAAADAPAPASASSAPEHDKNAAITAQAQGFLDRLPKQFDIAAVSLKYPTRYEESFNTVLVQECMRYNRLLQNIERSLQDLQKAVKGLAVMNAELEALAEALESNHTPALWLKYSYPCLKPLTSYFVDLLDRLAFISHWIENGIPTCFWISGFFFTQGFLTGCLQNFARKHVIAIDQLVFGFRVTDIMVSGTSLETEGERVRSALDALYQENPDGSYVYGFYMEGARFDMVDMRIRESLPRELYCRMPVIHFLPEDSTVQRERSGAVYKCPAYRTLARHGVLSTTGHSTNFILNVDLQIDEGEAAKWRKRGVALFTALNE